MQASLPFETCTIMLDIKELDDIRNWLKETPVSAFNSHLLPARVQNNHLLYHQTQK